MGNDLRSQEKVYLYEKMMNDKANMQEIVRLSFLREMITAEQYADYLQIEKDCEDNCDKD